MATTELLYCREIIDSTDCLLIQVIGQRNRLLDKILAYKKHQGLATSISSHRQAHIQRLVTEAEEKGLRPCFIESFFHLLADQAIIRPQQEAPLDSFFKQAKDYLPDFNLSLYHLDSSLCSLLAERIHQVKKVAAYKKAHHLPALDSIRWQALLTERKKLAAKVCLTEKAIEAIFDFIHEEALFLEKHYFEANIFAYSLSS